MPDPVLAVFVATAGRNSPPRSVLLPPLGFMRCPEQRSRVPNQTSYWRSLRAESAVWAVLADSPCAIRSRAPVGSRAPNRPRCSARQSIAAAGGGENGTRNDGGVLEGASGFGGDGCQAEYRGCGEAVRMGRVMTVRGALEMCARPRAMIMCGALEAGTARHAPPRHGRPGCGWGPGGGERVRRGRVPGRVSGLRGGGENGTRHDGARGA